MAIWVISSLGLLWTVLLRNCCTSLLIFWWIYVLITIGCIPWGQVAGLYSSCTLNFCRYRQRVFQVRCTLACLSAILVPLCPHQHLIFLDFYISAIRMGYIVGHFLNVKWEGFFFSYFASLLYEMPIHVFWAFTYWAMCPLIRRHEYILDKNLLSDPCTANIFSQSLYFLSLPLLMSLVNRRSTF